MNVYFSLGGTCDVMSLSWYPMWHGTFQDLRANIDNLSEKCPDQPVWVVETAYYYDGYCEPDNASCQQKKLFPLLSPLAIK